MAEPRIDLSRMRFDAVGDMQVATDPAQPRTFDVQVEQTEHGWGLYRNGELECRDGEPVWYDDYADAVLVAFGADA